MKYEIAIIIFLIPILEACPFLCNCILTWNQKNQLQNVWHCGQQGLTGDKLDLVTKDYNTSDVDVLYLTSNKFEELDGNKLKGFTNLKTLELGNNQLTTVPTSICQALPQLEVLKLENNTIGSITSDSFTDCNKLRHLKLSGNNIHLLVESIFSKAKNLEELNLSQNAIHSIHSDSLNGLLKLTKIDLSGNDIQKIPDDLFSGSHDVQWVDLSFNQITSLNRKLSKHLAHVEELYLANNALETLESGVFDGMKLKVLDLSNNDITPLDPSIFGQSVISKLLVDGNPLQCTCNLKSIVSDEGMVMEAKGSCALPKTLPTEHRSMERLLNLVNLTKQLNCENGCSSNNSCQNNGQCSLELDSNVEIYSYRCHCGSDFHGNYCELKKKTSKTLLVIVVIVVIPIVILIVGLILFRRQCQKKRRQRGDMLPLTDDDFAL